MSEGASRNISKSISEGVSGRDVAVGTASSLYEEDGVNNATARPTSGWQTTARSTEDSTSARCSFAHGKGCEYEVVDREQLFVIVDASCDSDPSSRELLVTEKKNVKAESSTGNKYFNKHVIPRDLPSTSHNMANNNFLPLPRVESDSREEMLLDINLQSENEIKVTDKTDFNSLVVTYLKNKEALSESDGTLMSSKKKPSLLESLHRLETIVEGQQFSTNREISDEELDILIPSYPVSLRSMTSSTSWLLHQTTDATQHIVDFLHTDNEFLIAAMRGNEKSMQQFIRANQENIPDIQGVDNLGRTALHLAAVTDNSKCVELALRCGINPNIKDKFGMTALDMCLMQRPSLDIITLLFNHGATIPPRECRTDIGLFLRFVMMCTPTAVEEDILRLLLDKGASINDPHAPGERQALHFAAMSNNCELIKVLVKFGANLHIINHRNETPLEVAVSFKCKPAADLLRNLMSDHTDIKIKCSSHMLRWSDSSSVTSLVDDKVDRSNTIISFD